MARHAVVGSGKEEYLYSTFLARVVHSKRSGMDHTVLSEQFSEQLLTIAKNNIPKSKFSVRKHNTVWFNDTSKEAISKRKKP